MCVILINCFEILICRGFHIVPNFINNRYNIIRYVIPICIYGLSAQMYYT